MESPIPVLRAVQMFLAFCSARNDSPNTLRAYNRDLLSFVQVIGHETPVTEITRKRIRQYLFTLDAGLKRSTVRRKIGAIRSFSNWLVMESYVDVSPCEGIQGPRLPQELPDVPSERDMAGLIDGDIPSACPERDRVILELLYSCGLRASEVVGVNVEHFSRDRHVLRVFGKGRKERLVPVGKKAQLAIAEWLPVRKKFLFEQALETPALLFSVGPRESLERLDVRTIGRVLKQVAVSKNLPPFHPHQLRHACATHMHDHGAPIQAIAAMLGHARLSTAQIYTQVSPVRMLDVYKRAHPHAQIS